MIGGTHKRKEITPLVVGAAVHVVGELHAVLRHVGRRVADGHGAVAAAPEVAAHVARHGLDVAGGQGARDVVVDDLVAREEGERVAVPGELVDARKHALQVLCVVRRARVEPVDRVERVVGVDDDVDAGVGERRHALVVVRRVVGDVDADRVDAQLLELRDVALADGRVRQGVRHGRGPSRLVVQAPDIEASLARPERCLVLLLSTRDEVVGCIVGMPHHFPTP